MKRSPADHGRQFTASLFCLLSLVSLCHAGIPAAGGLLSYPAPVVGENLLKNCDLSARDPRTVAPSGWRMSKAFSVVTTSSAGKLGFMLKDAPAFPYVESLIQEVYLTKGAYRFGGRVKTDLSDSKTKGVRFSLVGAGSTEVVGGCTDWRHLSAEKVYVPKDGKYLFKVESYAEPSGTAWFDDLYLKREAQPLTAFLQYPNYRGFLFEDQSQTARLAVDVEIPEGGKLADYAVVFTLREEGSDRQVYTATERAVTSFIHRIDCSSLVLDRSYILWTELVRTQDRMSVYKYPPYRIVKVPGALRKKMTVSFDEHNRFLVHDKPTFWLGVYDSGMGYVATEWQWEKAFASHRRLFDLPVNLYLNYWYGQASLPAMQTMMNVLNRRGIHYLQTGNAFNASYDPNNFAIDRDADYLGKLAGHGGLAGFYTVDEAVASLAPVMFRQYQRLKGAKPDGITFAALIDPNGLRYWRDTVDVLSMDPYPLFGAEPATGYNLAQVADWTIATNEAVQYSRPFMTVLQFFKATSKGRFPNREELRNMSYMAITEGANGLMYWSLGVNALAYVCRDWCDERTSHFEALKSVMNEIKGLEPALTSIDRPELLQANSNSSAVRIRVKYVGRRGYLFAYNYTNTTTSTTFSWAFPVRSIKVYNERRELSPRDNQFTDTFNPFEAHVYQISTDNH